MEIPSATSAGRCRPAFPPSWSGPGVPRPVETAAGRTLQVVLLLGFALVAAAGLPPHLSSSTSVDGAVRRPPADPRDVRPALYAKIVGLADAMPGGLNLLRDRQRRQPVRRADLDGTPAAARLLVGGGGSPVSILISPLVVVFQGVVWKDVLFANSRRRRLRGPGPWAGRRPGARASGSACSRPAWPCRSPCRSARTASSSS